MKKKELQEIRKKSQKDILSLVEKNKKELFKIMFDIKTGKEKNIKKAKNLRKEIAKLLTISKEIEIDKKNNVK